MLLIFISPFLSLLCWYIEVLLCRDLFLIGQGHDFLSVTDGFCFLDICAESASYMSFTNNTATETGSTFRLPPPYLVNTYIRRWSLHLHARRFATLAVSLPLAVVVVRVEREMALAGSCRRRKHWGVRRVLDDLAYRSFLDMPFFALWKEFPTKNHLLVKH